MIEYATLDSVVIHDLSIISEVETEEVAGLSGMPPIRGEVYERAEADGVVEPSFQYFGARVSAWTMQVSGTSEADAFARWVTVSRTLVKAMRAQKILIWRIKGSSLTLRATVRVASMTPPTWSKENGGYRVRFLVMFRHADPLNYDNTAQVLITGPPVIIVTGLNWPIVWPIVWNVNSTSAGTVSPVNAGDADAWPSIAITGPVTNPIVGNVTRGQYVYIDGLTVAAGQTMIIDCNPASRVVTVAGINRFGYVRFSASDFFPVSAGATEQIAFTGSATDPVTTTMTVTMRSAYIA